MAYSGTYATSAVYPQEWATKLQERLNKPQCWKDVANVIYSDKYIINVPYLSTEAAAASHTRGSAYTYPDNVITSDTLTISTSYVRAIYTDRADLAQMTLWDRMEQAERQASQLNEVVESAMLANTEPTDFGDTGGGALGLAATLFTVSESNIDDIIRGVRREVITANGIDLMEKNGLFFIWRPADFEFLEKFAQANGFNLADKALQNGIPNAYFFMGAYHYVSNSHTANHLLAGVRKIFQVGILKSTYGQVVVNDDPGLLSGIGMVARVDYGTNVPTGLKSVVFDINVN
jgi:hypothetical protein